MPAAAAAKTATKTIPIVFEVGIAPVEAGLVKSLNRPGGNLTGVVHALNTLGPKLLELLREIVPGAASVAVLINPSFYPNARYANDLQKAANSVGQGLQIVRASSEAEIDGAFELIRETGADALPDRRLGGTLPHSHNLPATSLCRGRRLDQLCNRCRRRVSRNWTIHWPNPSRRSPFGPPDLAGGEV